MSGSFLKIFTWVLVGMILPTSTISYWEQKASRFWEFKEETQTWVEISLPFDLVSCINETCYKVGSIERGQHNHLSVPQKTCMQEDKKTTTESTETYLPLRKRVSVAKMSEASIWVTAQSGSIYERFWNGVQWVLAPHDLPISAGHAISIFIINQTILALSEASTLYEMQLNEYRQPTWVELRLDIYSTSQSADAEPILTEEIKSCVVSHDGEKLYLSSSNGSLLELSELHPLRWRNQGRPPGADVASITDGARLRPGLIFTVSSFGELYEFDKRAKPSWKKHIWNGLKDEIISATSRGCTCDGFAGSKTKSLFLLSKDGSLVERRLQQRKWKWIVHGHPDGHMLSAITPVEQKESNERIMSLFCTTTSGSVFEYYLPKLPGLDMTEQWVNHMHPEQAQVARGVQGVQLQIGRMIFPLDDGRLGELHLPNTGGEGLGPSHQGSMRRRHLHTYEWSILEAPETEGWNGEYCTDRNGPANCLVGTKDLLEDNEIDDSRISTSTRKWKAQEYISLRNKRNQRDEFPDQKNFLTSSINVNFHMRTMHPERSFFLVTEKGLILEYLHTGHIWLWLKHEYSTGMKGVLGNYNGSIFMVDANGSLLIRERNGNNELSWFNCTSMKGGRQVATAAPWDGMHHQSWKATIGDALFFINKKGRLLQFMVALQKFKWKDCQRPSNTRIAYIVDQCVFRMNIIFVVGRNGRLYQYNKLSELWHEHYQSPHLVLSRNPGTAMRLSPSSLAGSLFMILDNGALVEYHWNSVEGWNWVEHGTPNRDTMLVGAPGPCFKGGQLFLIGSDGNVYRRYLYEGTWKWASHGHPHSGNIVSTAHQETDEVVNHVLNDNPTAIENSMESTNNNCDAKVSAVRPLPFSEVSAIFQLRDGRLAELRWLVDEEGPPKWGWVRIIATPTSHCLTDHWVAVAS